MPGTAAPAPTAAPSGWPSGAASLPSADAAGWSLTQRPRLFYTCSGKKDRQAMRLSIC